MPIKLILVNVFIIIFIILHAKTDCTAQINCTSGENIFFSVDNFITSEADINQISFKIKNSNPTIFYIDSIKINDIFPVEINRSYWEIECLASNLNNNSINNKVVNLLIYGTGLNGNDTATEIFFNEISFDDKLFRDTSITIISKNQYFVHSYAKFAKISSVYPNPIANYAKLTIEYSVDIPSDVKFRIFNEYGDELYKTEFYKADIGKNSLIIDTKSDFCAGKYWIFLETGSGRHYQTFILMK